MSDNMIMIRINSDRQNWTVHKSNIDEPDLLKMAVILVAKQIGIDHDASHISARAYFSSYQDGSLGGSRQRIVVELIEDHEMTGLEEAEP